MLPYTDTFFQAKNNIKANMQTTGMDLQDFYFPHLISPSGQTDIVQPQSDMFYPTSYIDSPPTEATTPTIADDHFHIPSYQSTPVTPQSTTDGLRSSSYFPDTTIPASYNNFPLVASPVRTPSLNNTNSVLSSSNEHHQTPMSSGSLLLTTTHSARQNKSPCISNTVVSQKPRITTSIWDDEGTICYQIDIGGICVARRQDNDMINGTKLLNVTGMSRGKRDGILKNERGRVVVKVGAMHLKGVWITFARAMALAAQFNILDKLHPLFADDPAAYFYYYPMLGDESRGSRVPCLMPPPGHPSLFVYFQQCQRQHHQLPPLTTTHPTHSSYPSNSNNATTSAVISSGTTYPPPSAIPVWPNTSQGQHDSLLTTAPFVPSMIPQQQDEMPIYGHTLY